MLQTDNMLIDIAMLLLMDTYNEVNINEKGELQVGLANGKVAQISIKKLEDKNLIQTPVKELKQSGFENFGECEKIMLNNSKHLMHYLTNSLPDIYFLKMFAGNIFKLENNFYQIKIT